MFVFTEQINSQLKYYLSAASVHFWFYPINEASLIAPWFILLFHLLKVRDPKENKEEIQSSLL